MRLKTIVVITIILLLAGWGTAIAQAYTPEDIAQELIGCWSDDPDESSGLGDAHNFYADGAYRYTFSEMAPFKTRYAINGDWEIKDGNLIIRLYSQEVREPSRIITDQNGYYKVETFQIHTETIDPPFVVRRALTDLDMRRDPDVALSGAETQIMERGEWVDMFRITMWNDRPYWRLSLIPLPKVLELDEYEAEWDAYYEAYFDSQWRK